MLNPILSQLRPQNNIANLKSILSGNPQQMAQNLLNNNPQFRQFVEENKGKTAEQIAQAYGIDYNTVLSLLR